MGLAFAIGLFALERVRTVLLTLSLIVLAKIAWMLLVSAFS